MIVTRRERRNRWVLCVLIAAGAMAAGMLLDARRPFWLALPFLIYTPLVYALLPWLWLPLLIVCALLRRVRRWRVILLVLSLGILAGSCWFALVAPRTGPELPYLGAQGAFQCRFSSTASAQAPFTCENHFPSSDSDYVAYTFRPLRGDGWISRLLRLPLVRLVDTQSLP
jgi:hypothetical protein